MITTPWLLPQEAAAYAKLRGRKAANRTITRWQRRGLIPANFIGHNGTGYVYLAPGIDHALATLRGMRLEARR